MRTSLRRRLGFVCALLTFLQAGGCVDDEQTGISTGLLAFDVPPSSLQPGSTADLAFQSVDDNGDGVPDQAIEVIITDLTRLHFKDSPNNRQVLTTDRSEKVGGVLLSGAIVAKLVIPADAKPGSVTVIASLAGDRSTSSKTQWVSIEIGDVGLDAGNSPGDAGPDASDAGLDQRVTSDDAGAAQDSQASSQEVPQ